MASPTRADISGDGSVVKYTWTLTTADHTGAGINLAAWADKTVTFTSAAWGGATAAVEGSNDNPSVETGAGDSNVASPIWLALSDIQGTAISRTADGIETIVELTQFTRPRLTAVGAGATVKATIVCRKSTPMRT